MRAGIREGRHEGTTEELYDAGAFVRVRPAGRRDEQRTADAELLRDLREVGDDTRAEVEPLCEAGMGPGLTEKVVHGRVAHRTKVSVASNPRSTRTSRPSTTSNTVREQ